MTLPMVIQSVGPAEPPPRAAPRRYLLMPLRWWFRGRPVAVAQRTLLLLATLAMLYFGLLGLLSHRIDNDPDFVAPVAVEGGSAAVAMAAGLVDREVNVHEWTVNDPLGPDAFLDNAMNFQQGILRATAQVSFQFFDQIGRARGSSSADPDLERATGLLQFPGDVWIFDFRKTWLPTVSSEAQYREAVRALLAYDARVAAGQAVFERRADALSVTLARVAADLGSRTAMIEREYQRADVSFFDTRVDDVFYLNMGMVYAYSLMLEALGEDFAGVIEERGVSALWAQAMQSLEYAGQLQPMIVMNGAGEDSIFANHLVLQGFYMKRAILQLEEIVRVLAV
ncbi:DUF2333 family protein [Rubellimicrobium roseum]|uniref:DUF2333 family protein n=1 Tax=Rubellimicrobium roseum TaxID=687525 RepID=A0A5C4N8Q3_9RHOB|nr:DUF2333 family protein [Rubellimicrobium roseum]TNC65816.1 DUF2333 family protein [Rubellimicrobium roseum]